MKPLRFPNWLLCAVAWRLLRVPANCLAEDQECARSDTNFDDIFEDEQLPLSLIQMKAKQIQGRRSDFEGTPLASVEPRSGDLSATAPSAEMGKPTATPLSKEVEILLDFGSLAQFDSRSSLCLFQAMATSIRGRFQIAVLIMTCGLLLVVMMFGTTWLPKLLKRRDSVLQVNFGVDHFVTHSQLTSKKIVDGPLKVPLVAQTQTASKQAALDGGDVDESLVPSLLVAEPPDQAVVAEVCGGVSAQVVRPAAASISIDPSFVLPLCETWYAVCVEPMAMCDGSFDILRIAGYPVLHGTLRHADGFRSLEITCSSLPAKQGQVLASVSIEAPPPTPDATPSIACGIRKSSENSRMLKVAGAGGKHCGNIRLAVDGSYVLACGQEDVMVLSAEDGQQLVLRSAECSKVLASASWFEQADVLSGAGHLAIRISPSVDTILMLSCALALTILGGDKSLVRFTCPADRGAG